MTVAVIVVFVDRPRLKEVVVLADHDSIWIGGAMVDRPKILVVEADGGLAEAKVVFDIAFHPALPFTIFEIVEGEMGFFRTDIYSLKWLELEILRGSLQDDEQEECHGDKAEYFGYMAHRRVRIGNR